MSCWGYCHSWWYWHSVWTFSAAAPWLPLPCEALKRWLAARYSSCSCSTFLFVAFAFRQSSYSGQTTSPIVSARRSWMYFTVRELSSRWCYSSVALWRYHWEWSSSRPRACCPCLSEAACHSPAVLIRSQYLAFSGLEQRRSRGRSVSSPTEASFHAHCLSASWSYWESETAYLHLPTRNFYVFASPSSYWTFLESVDSIIYSHWVRTEYPSCQRWVETRSRHFSWQRELFFDSYY